ncbi:MAG: hypothetical protein JST12_08500 [Armatimonadetes bacterium]|nr:hypothetical protein [Armatimonadota bacterium]
MDRPGKDVSGKLILKVIGIIVALFMALNIFFVVYRSRVVPKSIEKRRQVAVLLAAREWKEGTFSGKILDGKPDESNLPPQSPESQRPKEVENYSDTFNTSTAFEFEYAKPDNRCSIQVGNDTYTVHRENGTK